MLVLCPGRQRNNFEHLQRYWHPALVLIHSNYPFYEVISLGFPTWERVLYLLGSWRWIVLVPLLCRLFFLEGPYTGASRDGELQLMGDYSLTEKWLMSIIFVRDPSRLSCSRVECSGGYYFDILIALWREQYPLLIRAWNVIFKLALNLCIRVIKVWFDYSLFFRFKFFFIMDSIRVHFARPAKVLLKFLCHHEDEFQKENTAHVLDLFLHIEPSCFAAAVHSKWVLSVPSFHELSPLSHLIARSDLIV